MVAHSAGTLGHSVSPLSLAGPSNQVGHSVPPPPTPGDEWAALAALRNRIPARIPRHERSVDLSRYAGWSSSSSSSWLPSSSSSGYNDTAVTTQLQQAYHLRLQQQQQPTTTATDDTASEHTATSNTPLTATLAQAFSSMPQHLTIPLMVLVEPHGACSICCEEFRTGQPTMSLGCGHSFHSKCWQRYFVANSGWCTCPNCRAPSHVASHWVNMCPEEFGIATPLASRAGSDGGSQSHLIDPPAEENDNDASDSEMTQASAYPWWPVGPDGQQSVFHANTRLADGRVGLIIDTGAWANLSGETWAKNAASVCRRSGYTPTQEKLAKPLAVQGVGHGSQSCTWQTIIPAAVAHEDGTYSLTRYTSPCVPGSDLPALLGLRSLMDHGAIIDCRNRTMYLCGPGEAEIKPPPGTQKLKLEQAPSGHLVLPISEFVKYQEYVAQTPPWTRSLVPTQELALNASQSIDENGRLLESGPEVSVHSPSSSSARSSAASAPLAPLVAALSASSSTAAEEGAQQIRATAATDQSAAASSSSQPAAVRRGGFLDQEPTSESSTSGLSESPAGCSPR